METDDSAKQKESSTPPTPGATTPPSMGHQEKKPEYDVLSSRTGKPGAAEPMALIQLQDELVYSKLVSMFLRP